MSEYTLANFEVWPDLIGHLRYVLITVLQPTQLEFQLADSYDEEMEYRRNHYDSSANVKERQRLANGVFTFEEQVLGAILQLMKDELIEAENRGQIAAKERMRLWRLVGVLQEGAHMKMRDAPWGWY